MYLIYIKLLFANLLLIIVIKRYKVVICGNEHNPDVCTRSIETKEQTQIFMKSSSYLSCSYQFSYNSARYRYVGALVLKKV